MFSGNPIRLLPAIALNVTKMDAILVLQVGLNQAEVVLPVQYVASNQDGEIVLPLAHLRKARASPQIQPKYFHIMKQVPTIVQRVRLVDAMLVLVGLRWLVTVVLQVAYADLSRDGETAQPSVESCAIKMLLLLESSICQNLFNTSPLNE